MNINIAEKILKAAGNAINLKIRTIVGPVTIDSDNKLDTTVSKADDNRAMMTSINLIDGDITTKMDEEFVTGDYQNLRSFHLNKEEQGMQIIEGNIKVLKELAEFILEKGEALKNHKTD